MTPGTTPALGSGERRFPVGSLAELRSVALSLPQRLEAASQRPRFARWGQDYCAGGVNSRFAWRALFAPVPVGPCRALFYTSEGSSALSLHRIEKFTVAFAVRD